MRRPTCRKHALCARNFGAACWVALTAAITPWEGVNLSRSIRVITYSSPGHRASLVYITCALWFSAGRR